MDLKVDLHIHTVASGHAFSTLNEIIHKAVEKEMTLIGISDHGPSMDGASCESSFNMKDDIHREGLANNIKVLFGCEANILSHKGDIDISQDTLMNLDYDLAGLHEFTPYPGGDAVYNTKAILSCMEKNNIFAVSHPITVDYETDVKAIAEAAGGLQIALELNDRVFHRKNPRIINEYLKLIDHCKSYNTKMILSSDSHVLSTAGCFENIEIIKDSIMECPELILNNNVDKIYEMIEKMHEKR